MGMWRKIQRVRQLNYRGSILDPLYVILDHEGLPPVLPLMFSVYLSRVGIVYQTKEVTNGNTGRAHDLVPNEISDATIRSYIYALGKFLDHLETSRAPPAQNMHLSSMCCQKFINNYLNETLPKSLKSLKSLPTHLAALSSYFNWLHFLDLTPRMDLKIFRKTRQYVGDSGGTQHYIQYVTNTARLKLLNACTTLGEKLMMRMGYEVGLRTSEVAALRLDGKDGLQSIFQKLGDEDFNHIETFPYYLEGRYTKGGKSRWIYFDRELVRDMKRFFDSERKYLLRQSSISTNIFFLRTDKRFIGTPIGTEQASRVFSRRALQARLNPLLRFHDLRHTFATELFHEEVVGLTGRETRSESAALIVVAQRLGHKFTRSGQAPSTTNRYIRMRIEMLSLELEAE